MCLARSKKRRTSGRRRTVRGNIKVARADGHQFIIHRLETIASRVNVLPKKTSRKSLFKSFALILSFSCKIDRSILV